MFIPDKFEKMHNDNVACIIEGDNGKGTFNKEDRRNKITLKPNQVTYEQLQKGLKNHSLYNPIFFKYK